MSSLDALFRATYEIAPLWAWILVVLLVSVASRSPRVIGALGEFKLRFATDFRLDGRRFHPFHNLVLRTPDGTTQIDHVVICPYGIFVIETKNMKGAIYGGEFEKRWTQALWRKKYSFQNPLHQNYKHLKALQAAIDLDPNHFRSVVVFVGRSRFKTPMPSNVMKLNRFVAYMRWQSQVALTDEEIRAAIRQLKRAQIDNPFSRWIHLWNLHKNRHEPVCPRCGSKMVLRTAQKGRNAGGQFWGCSAFPNCKATKNVVGK